MTRTFSGLELQDLGTQIRAEVLKTHSVDSCIFTAAITVRTIRELGGEAFGLSVKTHVFGPRQEDGTRFGLGIGYPPEGGLQPGQWPGHVVAIVGRRWLCDFSIDQANRPEHGIALPLVVAEIDEPFLRGRGVLNIGRGAIDLEYMAVIGDRSYRTLSPEWDRGMRAEVTIERKTGGR